MQTADDDTTKMTVLADQLAFEAQMIHAWVSDSMHLLESEVHRSLIAHSAALVGKAKKEAKGLRRRCDWTGLR